MSRVVGAAVTALLTLTLVACDEAEVADPLTPSPIPSRAAQATPPSASQVALENSLGPWRPRQLSLIPSIEAAVVDACRAAPVSGFGGGDGPGELPVVTIDARGMGRATVVFADEERWSACLATFDPAGNVTVTAAVQPGDPSVAPVGDEDIAISVIEVLDDLESGQRSLAIGRVGKAAFWASAGFDDESWVDSKPGNGWYTLWWPGNVEAATMAASNSRNEVIGSAKTRD